MQIGIFGTGIVGTTIGSKVIELGHAVKMGARSASNEKAAAWAGAHGPSVSHGTVPTRRPSASWFGWRSVIDLGDITTARGVEMILPLWVMAMGVKRMKEERGV